MRIFKAIWLFAFLTTAALAQSVMPGGRPRIDHLHRVLPCTLTDGSGASLTFTSVSCTWTQIGNIVFVNFELTYPSTANGSVNQINGLPVASANAGYGDASCTGGVISGTTSTSFQITKNTTHGTFWNGNGVNFTNSNLSTLTVRASCQYPAS